MGDGVGLDEGYWGPIFHAFLPQKFLILSECRFVAFCIFYKVRRTGTQVPRIGMQVCKWEGGTMMVIT